MFLLELCGETYIKLVFAKKRAGVTAYGYFVGTHERLLSSVDKHSFAISGRFV